MEDKIENSSKIEQVSEPNVPSGESSIKPVMESSRGETVKAASPASITLKNTKSEIEKHEIMLVKEALLDNKVSAVLKPKPSNFNRASTFVEDVVKSEKTQLNKKSKRTTESQSTSSSRAGSLKATTSQISLAPSSSSSKNNVKPSKLPHALGAIPKYLQKSSNDRLRPSSAVALTSPGTKSRLSSAPSQVGSTIFDEKEEDLATEAIEKQKKQTLVFQRKFNESKLKIGQLTETVDKLSKTLKEKEKELAEKTQKLNDKLEKDRNTNNKLLKAQRDVKKSNEQSEDKLKNLEAQVEIFQKTNDELTKKLVAKDAQVDKMTIEQKRLKKDLGVKEKSNEALSQEKKDLVQLVENFNKDMIEGQGDSKKEQKLQGKIKDLEDQLKSRNFELSNLKKQSNTLLVENNSLKTKSIEGLKIDQKSGSVDLDQLKREVYNLKSVEKQLKQQVSTLTSKLDDETNKNFRMENLLQLRGEYVKTLQDTDEINKARLILQVKEVEDLRDKVVKLKNFKAAKNEELKNMHNTLESQEHQIKQLQLDLDQKDEKITKLKSKLSENERF